MSRLKLLGIELTIASFIGFFAFSMYAQNVLFFEKLNNKFTDIFFHIRGELEVSKDVVIVDIDEKSLAKLGQWPWSRDKVAIILDNLTNAGVGVIGLDIVFAERDRTSPQAILDRFGFTHKDAEDHDEVLAETFRNSPVVAGYLFDFEKRVQKGQTPDTTAIIVEKNFENRDFLPEAKGVIANIPILQSSAYSSGFFNTIPDSDGIVRRVPLMVSYRDRIYPSLALEMLRFAYGVRKIVINYSDIGITHIGLDDLVIPTDRFGRVTINYMGGSKLFSYISAVDIYSNQFDIAQIENKIVLIGTSASGLFDLRATPLQSTYPGVEIHATLIDNVLSQNFISHPSWIEAVDIVVLFVVLLFVVLLFVFFGALVSAFLSMVFTVLLAYIAYYLFINEGLILNVVYPFFSLVLLYLVLSTLHYFLESKQKKMIQDRFSKKVSKTVAKTLMEQGGKDILEAKDREITIFFSDIRGFTSISQELKEPKRIIEFLNIYMTPMTNIIMQNQGTVDKFIGDSIMAYWNAPLEIKDHADKALQSAIEQVKELESINIKLKKMGYPSIDMGIGINTGAAVVGEMGSSDRSDYTVVGDSINLGSRLEGLCKTYKERIIISEFTKNSLKKEYNIEFLDSIKVKGRGLSVDIYRVIL